MCSLRMTVSKVNRIAYTPGEPGGIGADLILTLAQQPFDFELVVFGCPEHLAHRAMVLGLNLNLSEVNFNQPPQKNGQGQLRIYPIPLKQWDIQGTTSDDNREGILESLRQAFKACYRNQCQALVTGPVHKSVLSTADKPFPGHTEFLAHCAALEISQRGSPLNPTHQDVMMAFYQPGILVGLATTHIPLNQVSSTLTQTLIASRVHHMNQALVHWFGIQSPKIGILGLNPHAGESGQIGSEEIEVLEPAINNLKTQGLDVVGPMPGDSAFLPECLKEYDGLLAMYHDQGLGPLKSMGFGQLVNVTLGLPIIRTSVDHGTALTLAGTGKARPDGLKSALTLANQLCHS